MKLTQEQLAKLIADVFTYLEEKRAAQKEAGEPVTELSTDDILEALNEVIGDVEPVAEGEVEPEKKAGEPVTEGVSEDEKVTPELIAMVMEALKGVKKTVGAEEKKNKEIGKTPEAPAPTPQRKYAGVLIGNSRSLDGGVKNLDFRSRMENLPTAERRKMAYGMFGRAVKCIHSANGDIERAAYNAEQKFRDAEMAREFKALSVANPTGGGYLVPEVYANEIIELLYPSTVIYALGARKLGMDNGNLNIPKVKTGSRAMFNGENRKIPKTAPKFGNLKLSAKKLTALIPMSNDLLRSTNFDNDVIVGQDITKQMALGVDFGALLGTGGEFQPLGIINNNKVQNIDVTGIGTEYASSTGVLTAAFPNYLVAAVLRNNVYADGLGFVFNTSVEQFFKSVRDNSGAFIFAEEMNKNRTLAGYPYRTTNLLETTAGKTQIIFGNWNDLVIGEQGALEIETSREGSWTDDAGNLVSAFENDQTLIRAINNVDTGLRHDESFAVATKVAVPV